MIIKEAGRVSNDPRNGAMRDLWFALREGWAAFREELELQAANRAAAAAEAKRRARLRAMSDAELMICAIQWNGEVCYPELRRRGLPVPGEVTSA